MAAVLAAHRSSPRIGTSRTSSPMDNKKSAIKPEDFARKKSPLQAKPSLSDPQPEEQKSTVTSEPLAPPPRPAQANATETPDYFSALHSGNHFTNELNPFEQSFGQSSADTPGKSLQLPSVAALTSPQIPGTNSTPGFNWPNQLRSGHLSPAMLPGPTSGAGDYFDSIGRGFPTPNESSLRTGLTPGGGGSMFPAPSPNSQAIFQQLQSGGATPGTLDFHRTAMNAAAMNAASRNKTNQFTSNPGDMAQASSMDPQHDATDAANGLFMLAKGGQSNNQFAMPSQPQQAIQTKAGQGAKNGRTNGNISGPEMTNAESPESVDESSRPSTRGGRGKKSIKAEAASSTRRKSESTPKGSNKRAKGNSGSVNVDPALDPGDDDDDDMSEDDDDNMPDEINGKKMTDEEKRRNFLERNRVAALKCRQRKKQWLANLQAKVEMYSAENEALNSTVATLHDEIRQLRNLLMGHKDCPIGHAQGIGNYLSSLQDAQAFQNSHVNPYGMAMGNGVAMQAGMQQGMQRS